MQTSIVLKPFSPEMANDMQTAVVQTNTGTYMLGFFGNKKTINGNQMMFYPSGVNADLVHLNHISSYCVVDIQ